MAPAAARWTWGLAVAIAILFAGTASAQRSVVEESVRIVFTSFKHATLNREGPRAAKLIDDEHLLTKDHDKRIVLWKLPEMTPVFSHTINSIICDDISLSPDRRYFVLEEGAPDNFRYSPEIS